MNKIFYTDGACSGNPGPGGFGVVSTGTQQVKTKNVFGNAETKEVTTIEYFYEEQCQNTTNNREELKAILHVFQLAAADKENEYTIYSDSAYAVNMINNWIYSWAKNNWLNSKNKQVENLDLVKELYKYVTTDFFNCQVKKVSGHAGEVGNELADALATNNKNKFYKFMNNHNIYLAKVE